MSAEQSEVEADADVARFPFDLARVVPDPIADAAGG
jgi:hypothetical protein